MAKKKYTVDELIREFIRLRDKRAEMKAEFDVDYKKLGAKQDKIQAALLAHLNKHDRDSIPTAHGTAFLNRKKYARITDPDEIAKYIQETGDVGVYQQRLSNSHIEKLLEDGVEVPGTKFSVERTITIRKPTSKSKKG